MSKKSKAKAKAAKRFAVNQVAKESLSAVPSQEQVAADDELVMDAPTAHPTSEPCNLEDAPDAPDAQREAEELAADDAAEAAQEAEAARVSAEAAEKEAVLEEAAATQQQASYAGVLLAESATVATVDDADDVELVEQEDAMLVEAESPEAESAAEYSPRAEAFSGLFYCDGIDHHGKPVVIIDTDYLPPTKAQRQAAADWLKEAMAPAVEAGEYSIVILGSRRTRASSWDSWWMAQQYKSLARPVRKNVQLLVWVNPTSVTKMAIGLMKPFVSKKGAKKIRIVRKLEGLEQCTAGRLTVASLGSSYLETYST